MRVLLTRYIKMNASSPGLGPVQNYFPCFFCGTGFQISQEVVSFLHGMAVTCEQCRLYWQRKSIDKISTDFMPAINHEITPSEIEIRQRNDELMDAITHCDELLELRRIDVVIITANTISKMDKLSLEISTHMQHITWVLVQHYLSFVNFSISWATQLRHHRTFTHHLYDFFKACTDTNIEQRHHRHTFCSALGYLWSRNCSYFWIVNHKKRKKYAVYTFSSGLRYVCSFENVKNENI